MCLLLIMSVSFGAAGQAEAINLTSQQWRLVKTAESWLDNLVFLESRFIQTNPDGSYGQGKFYLARPGRLRVDYDQPSDLLIIANHGQMQLAERQAHSLSYIPISSTPLAMLLADKISFDRKDFSITEVQEGNGVASISFKPTDESDRSRLTLQFSTSPMALQGWQIIDNIGAKTSVSLQDSLLPSNSQPLADELFIFLPAYSKPKS